MFCFYATLEKLCNDRYLLEEFDMLSAVSHTQNVNKAAFPREGHKMSHKKVVLYCQPHSIATFHILLTHCLDIRRMRVSISKH